MLALLKFVAKAALNAIGGGVAGDLAVEVLPRISRDVWSWWSKERDEAGRRADVQAVAQMPPAEIRQAAADIVQQVAAGQPPALCDQIRTFIELIPKNVQQSLRRTEDPSGRTVPAGLSLNKPADLERFLPPLPRFKVGDRPLPGVDWQLTALLGVGGFGEVWKAKNPRFDGVPPVALKFCLDPAARDRLLQHEAGVLNQVMRQGAAIKGIVPLRHTYLSADPPCLEYEFIDGGDLGGLIYRLRHKGLLTPEVATKLMLRLARTLGGAHRLKPPIVHRDLKPANILVQNLGGGKVDLRVADFGIGGVAAEQALDVEKGTDSGSASTRMLLGSYTPLYASPQQREGGPPDPRDDVHALGVIWYQMLIGDISKGIPQGGKWKQRLAEQGVPVPAVELLGDCIENEPADRPPDAGVLFDRLNALLTPTPTVEPKPGDVSTNSLGMQFAFVPRGSFLMGGEGGKPGDEQVTIERDFRLGVYPVTQGQWQAIMGGNPSWFSRYGRGKNKVANISDAELKDFPVEQVSWDDVQEFLRKLNEREKESGLSYRLPTEAEWEYSCRGGAASSGGSISPGDCSFHFYFAQPTNSLSSQQANFNGDYPHGGAGTGPYLERTYKVGSYQPNRLGIYDLHGNIWEWCEDSEDGVSTRVFRGGGCYDGGQDCGAATRDGGEPSWRGGHVGFRLAQVPSPTNHAHEGGESQTQEEGDKKGGRKERTLKVLQRHGQLAEGTPIEVMPDAISDEGLPPDPKVFGARMGNMDSQKSVIWAFDDSAYSLSELSCKLEEHGLWWVRKKSFELWRIVGQTESMWEQADRLRE